VLVNSWPSPVGDGSTDVSIEYEIDSNASGSLENVVIIIPLPMYSLTLSPHFCTLRRIVLIVFLAVRAHFPISKK